MTVDELRALLVDLPADLVVYAELDYLPYGVESFALVDLGLGPTGVLSLTPRD